jgi:hypothetical protein
MKRTNVMARLLGWAPRSCPSIAWTAVSRPYIPAGLRNMTGIQGSLELSGAILLIQFRRSKAGRGGGALIVSFEQDD